MSIGALASARSVPLYMLTNRFNTTSESYFKVNCWDVEYSWTTKPSCFAMMFWSSFLLSVREQCAGSTHFTKATSLICCVEEFFRLMAAQHKLKQLNDKRS